MKVWLYYRLSRDEDEKLESLKNQRQIIYHYAIQNGHEIVGESFDDNMTGMNFDRPGIEKIYDAVDAGQIEGVIVKDLSRLGRHRTQTALFIDYLRTNHVRVLSATESIDSMDEDDELAIGFKELMNDFYARDGSRRVRTGYRQKQKDGIVIIPPFGYFKDKNTGEIQVIDGAAETVRMIYAAYENGMGMRAVAKMLNEQHRETPAQLQKQLLAKRMPKDFERNVRKKYLWSASTVKRILIDESYMGTLICHKSERNKINKTFRYTNPEEQFRHENYYPVIIDRQMWEQTQQMIAERTRKNVRAAPGRSILRYSGLLRCKDCGRTFIGKRVRTKAGERVEYRCDTYHRFGKEYCTAHTVDEDVLDGLICKELLTAKDQAESIWQNIEKMIRQWTPKDTSVEKQIQNKKQRIEDLECDVEEILMERIRDKGNVERYDRMIAKREEEIKSIKQQIEDISHIGDILKQRQASLRQDINLLDQILSEEKLSEANLRMLVEQILVHEDNGELELEIRLKAPFRNHIDRYENGIEVEDILNKVV